MVTQLPPDLTYLLSPGSCSWCPGGPMVAATNTGHWTHSFISGEGGSDTMGWVRDNPINAPQLSSIA